MRLLTLVRRARADRGSLSVYFIAGALAIVPLIGLVVDGGGQIRATQRADLVADEAARSAAQLIEPGDAIQGDAIYLDPRAPTRAREYVQSQGLEVESVVLEPNDRSITVTTRATYEPVFLGALGLGPWTVTGTSTARVQQTDLYGNEYER